MRIQDLETFGKGATRFSAPSIDLILEHGSAKASVGIFIADTSQSTEPFIDLINKMMSDIGQRVANLPENANIFYRAAEFSGESVNEIHGFMPASDLDVDLYGHLNYGGGTPLFYAGFNAMNSAREFVKILQDADMKSNVTVFLMTDGENMSDHSTNEDDVAKSITSLKGIPGVEVTTVLLGLTAPMRKEGEKESEDDKKRRIQLTRLLEDFHKKAGFDHFLNAGKVSADRLMEIANLFTNSMEISSRSLGKDASPQKEMEDIIKGFETDNDLDF